MIERRTYQLSEIRADKDGEEMRVKGHAAVFNQKSEQMFGFREIVLPGAFKRSLEQSDVRALWNHDTNFVLGRTKAGTLSLREDKTGLFTEIDFPNTAYARDIFTLIKRGDVDQMSFGFRTITDKWRTENKETVRELVDVELFDVSPVTFPAYPQTDISARQDEIRSYYEQKIKEIDQTEGQKETQDGQFAARMKEREEFLACRQLPPDPYDLKEILRKASK